MSDHFGMIYNFQLMCHQKGNILPLFHKKRIKFKNDLSNKESSVHKVYYSQCLAQVQQKVCGNPGKSVVPRNHQSQIILSAFLNKVSYMSLWLGEALYLRSSFLRDFVFPLLMHAFTGEQRCLRSFVYKLSL